MHELFNKSYKETYHLMKPFILWPANINGLHIYAYTNDALSF